MNTKNYISTSGLNNLKQELSQLNKERDEHIAAMRVALQQENGDKSENSEYLMLESELNRIQNSIGTLSEYISNCAVVSYEDKAGQTSDKVRFGCKVTILNTEDEKEYVYRILGEKESNPKDGVISHLSPLGLALVGKELDDYVDFLTPKNEDIEYQILDIRY